MVLTLFLHPQRKALKLFQPCRKGVLVRRDQWGTRYGVGRAGPLGEVRMMPAKSLRSYLLEFCRFFYSLSLYTSDNNELGSWLKLHSRCLPLPSCAQNTLAGKTEEVLLNLSQETREVLLQRCCSISMVQAGGTLLLTATLLFFPEEGAPFPPPGLSTCSHTEFNLRKRMFLLTIVHVVCFLLPL